jgi:hypothetical protein
MIAFDPPELAETVSSAFRAIEKALEIEIADLSDDIVDPGAEDFSPNIEEALEAISKT